MYIKLIRVGLLTMLTFLVQTTIPSTIAIGNVAPNLALVSLAVVSVGWGRKYTFFMSLFIGYLIEITLPSLNFLNMILYPVSATLGALLFSDKSERALEEKRTPNSALPTQMNPHLRTPLAALVSAAIFEGVHLIYIYLNGVTANADNISRAVTDIVYTTVICIIFQFPLRWILGIYKIKKAR